MALLEQVLPGHPILHRMRRGGTLATRIRRRVGPNPTRPELRAVYEELADCLRHGTLFDIAAATPSATR